MGQYDNKEYYCTLLAGKVALPDDMLYSVFELAHKIGNRIAAENRQHFPDNNLIDLLCNAARLGYQYLELKEKLELLEKKG